MAVTERVLLDTSAFYALRSQTDRFHPEARDTYERLIDWERELWTTSYALVETVALMHRRLGMEAVSAFADWQGRADLQVVWIDRRMHSAAWDRFMASNTQSLSLVDWTLAMASREMSAPVFTFDSGFALQGLPVLPR